MGVITKRRVRRSLRGRVKLWDAINAYAQRCGGDTSGATISDARIEAVRVVEVELRNMCARALLGGGGIRRRRRKRMVYSLAPGGSIIIQLPPAGGGGAGTHSSGGTTGRGGGG